MDTAAQILWELAIQVGEENRARWLTQHFSGYAPGRDSSGNVYFGSGPLMLLAHIDTVLQPWPKVVESEGKWWSPGIGDNSSGAAILASLLGEVDLTQLTLGFTVGEEGLGNLRGARALVGAFSPRQVIAVDGYLGSVVMGNLGIRRIRAELKGPGGHAWANRQAGNPAVALGQALIALFALRREGIGVNVGRVYGGEAINAVPSLMSMELDLRAAQAGEIDWLEAAAREVLMEAARAEGVSLELTPLGERPAGRTANAQMLKAAEQALADQGWPAHFREGSTDAGAAIERGIPALGFGVYLGNGAHTEEEWVDPKSLTVGRRSLLGLIANLEIY
jgi:acetylornithine deacetylase/succinyl-diaminopimelate desuccinylase-like protein